MTEENHMGWKLMRGVRLDVVKLFKLFASCNSVRYENFCKVWKDMKFYMIFSCRQIYIERIEFVEEVFQIVKEYLLSVYEFHTRIAALYTLYALYFKQPLRPPAKIRFTKTQWAEVQSLIATCKEEKHYDVVFIYMKLYLNNAFQFTATARTTGLELGFRKYFRKKNTVFPNSCDVELLYRPLLSENLVSSLVQLEELYCKKKLELLGKRNIDFIDTKFSVHLQDQLKKHRSGDQKVTRGIESDKPGPSCSKLSNTSDLPSKIKFTSDKQGGKESGHKSSRLKHKQKELAKKKAEKYVREMHEENDGHSCSKKVLLELPDLE